MDMAWNLKKHLQKGEKIIYEGTPKWIGYFWGFILALITIPTGIIMTYYFSWYYFTLIIVLTVVIPIIIVLRIILSKLSTKYAITNKRVIARRGILSENFKSSTFKHITSLGAKQGIIGKIFNFGNIIVNTSGSGGSADFVWKYVENHVKIKNKMEKRII